MKICHHYLPQWKLVSILVLVFYVEWSYGHGRLIEPPSRASAWRYGFSTPPDYNDHELYCGGFTRQWKRNNGKCGVCGDAWDLKEPRPHENGGQWGQGVVVRKYLPGSEIVIRVELTASHMGYFEFRICQNPDATQDCLDQNVLKILNGSPASPMPTDLKTRFYPRNGSRIYEMKAQLPDLKCNQCVLQWRYIAGNNWGMCPDGNGAVGCGPQEEFRSCADIALGEGAHTPIRPMRPTTKSTLRPKVFATSTESSAKDNEASDDDSSSITKILLAFIILIIICALLAWYLHRYHSQRVKEWFQFVSNRICWNQNKQNLTTERVVSSQISPIVTSQVNQCTNPMTEHDKNMCLTLAPPVPPPRTKRNSQVKELTAEQSSLY